MSGPRRGRRSSIIEINPPGRLKLFLQANSPRIDSEYLTSFRSFFHIFLFSFYNHCISSYPFLAFTYPPCETDDSDTNETLLCLLSLSFSLIFLLLREHKEVTKGLTGPKITLLYGNERRGKVWPGPLIPCLLPNGPLPPQRRLISSGEKSSCAFYRLCKSRRGTKNACVDTWG